MSNAVKQFGFLVDNDNEKDDLVKDIIKQRMRGGQHNSCVNMKMMIFVDSAHTFRHVQNIVDDIDSIKKPTTFLCGGDMDPNNRKLSQEQFENDRNDAILIATPSLGTGTDIHGVTDVVLFNIPSSKAYHQQATSRCARGRDGFTGCAFTPYKRTEENMWNDIKPRVWYGYDTWMN